MKPAEQNWINFWTILATILILILSNLSHAYSQQIIGRKPLLGSQINFGNYLSGNIAGLWLLNEGSGNIVFDFFNNHNGSFNNMDGTNWMPGKNGWALDFNGTNEDVLLGLHSDILGTSSTQPFTVAVWAKADAIPTSRDGIIASLDNATGAIGWDLRLENGGLPLNGAVFSIAGNRAAFTTSDFVETDWNFYCGRFDGTNIEVFVNAVLGGTAATGSVNGTNRNIYIGANFFPGTPGSSNADLWFNGKISYVIIYDRALTDNEIMKLYIKTYAMFEQPLYGRILAAAAAAAPSVTRRRFIITNDE